jgi:hypothetical protein
LLSDFNVFHHAHQKIYIPPLDYEVHRLASERKLRAFYRESLHSRKQTYEVNIGMKTKAVIRKLAALGTGIAMMGATMAGALAADLGDYPGLFYRDNKLNAAIVVGDTALSIDVVGAIDLAASLQYGAREEKVVSLGGTETITAAEGVKVIASGNHLNLAEGMSTVSSRFRKTDLPVLLADGKVRDKSENKDYKYDLYLYPGAHDPSFGLPDEDVFGAKPLLYLDQSAGAAYTIKVKFDTALNVTTLDDSEKITIMDRVFTFDPNMDKDSNTLTLFASERTETLSVGETKTLTLEDGGSLTIELIGANSDRGTATLRIDGETYQVASSDSISPAGTTLYINDVFTYNIPTPGAAVELFVGSDKIEIDESATYSEVEVDSEGLDGYYAAIGSGDLGAVDYINFTFIPSEMDASDDRYHYLFEGETLLDPLFKSFELKFSGVTPAFKSESKSRVSLTRANRDYKLSFSNRDGQDYLINLFSDNSDISGALKYHNDFVGGDEDIAKNKIFILNEGNEVTRVWKLMDVDSDEKVKVRDLADNTDYILEDGDAIGDSAVKIANVNNNPDYINLSADASLQILVQYKGLINITSDPANETLWDLIFIEGTNNFNDLTTPAVIQLNLTGADADYNVRIIGVGSSQSETADDDDGDVNYGLTKFGTYWEYDKDKKGAYFDLYYPEVEQSFHAFFLPVGVETTTTAGGDTLTYYEYNKIEVGAAQLASDIADAKAQNLIVVGGPCANKVAADLLNLGPGDDCSAGFTQGQAVLRLIENGQNVALLVAGYSGEDTRKATAVLANHEDYTLSGKEMVVKGTSMQEITVEAPAPVTE